jgi:hypothetical protein
MRRLSTYTNAEKKELQRESEQLLKEIEFNDKKGINVLYKEQETCGARVADVFANDLSKVNILVCGKTQTGKTGCMLAVIKSIITTGLLPVNNIFIITGLSSIDWINDTIARMPYALRNNIFHRGNLKKTIPLIKNKKNCLIIIDEIQIGGEATHTISLVFDMVGLYDVKYLFDNNIKIVQFTATPDGHIYDILKWGHMSAVIKLEPGRGYTSSNDLLSSGRVRQYKSLIDIEAIEEIKTVIEDKYGYRTDNNSPRYHTIRIPSSKYNIDRIIIDMFKRVFGNDFRYEEKFIEKKKDNINIMLSMEPFMHTFIFIKDILRCAKTKHKRYLGIEYERYAMHPYDSTIIQGSIGRLTGYDDNGDSVCFTNIESIEKYQELWDASFNKLSVRWNSATTNEGKRNNKLTFNSAKMYKNMERKTYMRKWARTNITEAKFIFSHDKKINITCRVDNKELTIKNPFTPARLDKKTGRYKCAITGRSNVYEKKEMIRELETIKNLETERIVFTSGKNRIGWEKGENIYNRVYICYENNNPVILLMQWRTTAKQIPFEKQIDGVNTPEYNIWLTTYPDQ